MNTEIEYTPWQAKPFASPPGTFFIVDRLGQLVFGAGKPLTEANAHLIAAAPDLLVAIKYVRKYYADSKLAARTLRLVDAAISKAEGRQ